MIKLISLFALLLVSTSSFSQEKTIYFDADWQPTTKNKMVYFRPVPKAVNGKFLFKDYYKSGKLQFEGFSLSKTEEKFEGLVTYYGEDGQNLGQSNFKNGILNGDFTIYYPDGKLKSKGTYLGGEVEKSLSFNYRGLEDWNEEYDLATKYNGAQKTIEIIFDGNIKGIRKETFFEDRMIRSYDETGKLIGEVTLDYNDEPVAGIVADYIFSPMKVEKIHTYKDGKEVIK
ncbi:toxin-antitoxin system YwqK family antitoxin [Pedobacter punctiformis]|uniref:Toxin-antitoxin system YwqK family antitoxin n=1 Tax=Pedobacter punctiformis TaxID=3004097 RepID=A0ABT4L3W5_9SPHI|nr:hypothetical protein [Pedobacter sp. HCMS5-2]MCZ4242614.1 hypothetical protein [Pedobacter sp. HCMS5-2]